MWNLLIHFAAGVFGFGLCVVGWLEVTVIVFGSAGQLVNAAWGTVASILSAYWTVRMFEHAGEALYKRHHNRKTSIIRGVT